MLECLIIGDSIGLGISKYRPECFVQARVGINTRNWLNTTMPIKAKKVLISLGSNENNYYPANSSVQRNYLINTQINDLQLVRNRQNDSKVYWVLPENNPVLKYHIRNIALRYGDNILEIQKLQKDGVHPTEKEYKNLSQQF
jgi:hypothetical protein